MLVESDSVFFCVGFTRKFTYDLPVVSNHKNSGVFVLFMGSHPGRCEIYKQKTIGEKWPPLKKNGLLTSV